jgi:hypothetical protein
MKKNIFYVVATVVVLLLLRPIFKDNLLAVGLLIALIFGVGIAYDLGKQK